MSENPRPANRAAPLPSEVLKGIVGGAQQDDKQKIDDQTAIGMTAGADEAGHAPLPVPQAGPVEDKTSIETKSSQQGDAGKGTSDRNAVDDQHLQQGLTTVFVALKSAQAEQDALQKAIRTERNLESGEPAHKTAIDLMQQALLDVYESQQKLAEAKPPTLGHTSKLGSAGPDKVEDHDATSSHQDDAMPEEQKFADEVEIAKEAASHDGYKSDSVAAMQRFQSIALETMPRDLMPDPDVVGRAMENLKQAVKVGDSDAIRTALTDLFGKPAAEPAHKTDIDVVQQASHNLDEAQQKPTEAKSIPGQTSTLAVVGAYEVKGSDADKSALSTPESKLPSDDEIADQINRNVGVDQAAELASAGAWHDDEQLKYKELIEKLWALARATGDTFLSNQISYLVTGHNHYVWQLESDQHAKYLAQTISQAKAILGDISLAREIVGFKTRDVKQAEAELEQAKAAGDAVLTHQAEGWLQFAISAKNDAERVLESKIKWREGVLRMHKQAEKEGNAGTVQSLKNVRDKMEKLYSEYASKPRPDADTTKNSRPREALELKVQLLKDKLEKWRSAHTPESGNS